MAQMQRPTGKVALTPAQRAAKLAAEKKAYEAYKKSRPSKEKLAEIYNEQQSRLRRSKTVAPNPAVKRSAVKPAPLGTAPAAPRRGTATPAPLGTPSTRPSGRRTAMPKTIKKAPAKPIKKQEKMTPQDAAMKKILEGKYGKIYG